VTAALQSSWKTLSAALTFVDDDDDDEICAIANGKKTHMSECEISKY